MTALRMASLYPHGFLNREPRQKAAGARRTSRIRSIQRKTSRPSRLCGEILPLSWGIIFAMDEGTVLNNRYQLLERLGHGGMSDVFRARDLMLERYVAIKVLSEQYS